MAGALPGVESQERMAQFTQPAPTEAAQSVTTETPVPSQLSAPKSAAAGGVSLAARMKQSGKWETFAPALAYSRNPLGYFGSLFADRKPKAETEASARRSGPVDYSVNGSVRTAQGQGLEGATVRVQRILGSEGPLELETTSGFGGSYSFFGLPEGSTYQITVSKAGFSIAPSAQDIYIFRDEYGIDFTATLLTYSISGTVTNASGQAVSGVTLTLPGSSSQTTTTNASGQYTFSNLPWSGNFTITPAKSGQVFAPSARSYTNLTANQTGQNFTASAAPPPSGSQTWSKTINYRYNAVGALTSIGTDLTGTDPNATTNVISGIGYTGFGATQTVSYGNGRRLTLGYDTSRHQMTSMIVDHQNGTDQIVNRTYSYTTPGNYDNDGRIKKITDNLDPNYTATYTYDAYNRLATARGGLSGGTYYRHYNYDAWGNLLRVDTSNYLDNATSYSVSLATNRVNSVR